MAGTRGHYLSEIRATERPIPNPLMGEIPSPRNKTKIKVIGQRTDWWLPETGGREGVRVGEHAGLSCWCGSDATLLMGGHLLSLLQFSSHWGRGGAWSCGGFFITTHQSGSLRSCLLWSLRQYCLFLPPWSFKWVPRAVVPSAAAALLQVLGVP